MKKIVILLIIFAVLIYALPFTALLLPAQAENTAAAAKPPASSVSLPAESQPQAASKGRELLILDEGSSKVLRVSEWDFVVGAVAAEMPYTWHDEALKAQAVAAHSYALALIDQYDPNDASLKGAYFKANPSQRLGFLTDEVMQLVWKENYAVNKQRIEGIVSQVFGEILTFSGKPALACYHAISAGSTISSEAVWGRPLEYLVSVDSTLDLTSPDYEKTATLSEASVREAILMNFAGIELPKDAAQWFSQPKTSPEGYITEINIGTTTVKANDLRNALKLRSCAFEVSYSDGSFVFVTKGYGHGVGMSQYGAQSLALTEKSYKDILAHYYPAAQLTKN